MKRFLIDLIKLFYLPCRTSYRRRRKSERPTIGALLRKQCPLESMRSLAAGQLAKGAL
jgi:hypothetical protein